MQSLLVEGMEMDSDDEEDLMLHEDTFRLRQEHHEILFVTTTKFLFNSINITFRSTNNNPV